MKYSADYQFTPKGAARPSDDGRVVNIEATDDRGFALLPNVGDYVNIDNSTNKGPSSFSGKVRSRLFNYICTPSGDFCHVNIVVAEDDDDWGKLIKE
jgi:hypothetical protein